MKYKPTNPMTNELTKDQAREYLEKWIEHKMNVINEMRMPIVDEVVINLMDTVPYPPNESGFWQTRTELTQYTFRHLIKIAYNLKDND